MVQREFVDALVEDLVPVRAARPLSIVLLGWSLLAALFVSTMILWSGPLREGSIATLIVAPRYSAELLLGILASVASIAAGLEVGVPGRAKFLRVTAPAALALVGWVGLIALGAFAIGPAPGTLVSMAGKRIGCEFEILFLSALPWAIAWSSLRRRALFSSATAGASSASAQAPYPPPGCSSLASTIPITA